MSIEQLDKVDFISEKPNGEIALTISDHLDWKNEQSHLALLQSKLYAYLDFIESGQLNEKYPNSNDTDIWIDIVMKFNPTESSLVVINQLKNYIESEGYKFSWRNISES